MTLANAKVTAMMMDIRAASGLGAAALKSAQEALQRHERTFGPDTDHKQPECFRLRKKLPADVHLGLLQQASPERHPSP